VSVALVFYLNFLFGYAMTWPGADVVGREARERDYFFLVSFSVWGVWAGIGIAALWHRLAARVGGLVWASPILLAAAIPLVLNWSWASRAGDYAPRSFAYDELMSVEPYGVLFTNGDNDTFPMWYLQEVEGIRRDVTVIVPQYLNTAWYPRQLQELTTPGRQRLFDSTRAGDLYPDSAPPARPIVRSTPEELDAIRGGRIEREVIVPFAGLALRYPAGTVFERRHQMALQIMHDSIDERPIYFSSSAGLMRELGLDAFAVRQGLVSKLVLRPLNEPQPAELVHGSPEMGGEWFDYERSMKLYHRVYDFSGFLNREVWPDHANTIPWSFYALALQLSDVAKKRGAPAAQVGTLERDAEAFRITAEGGLRGALNR
jgi:hypothetical protein